MNERTTVQAPLVTYAGEISWDIVPEGEALAFRCGESGLFFHDILRDRLLTFNPEVVTSDNVDEVLKRMENARPSVDGNREMLEWLRGEQSVHVAAEKRHRNVTVIDFAHPERNVYHVTVEWQYTNGRSTSRADVMFLINGVPVAVVETKSAKKPDAIDEGIDQIRRYHWETPEMMTAAQVFGVVDSFDFYYGVTWNLDRKGLFEWKPEAVQTSSLRKAGKLSRPDSLEQKVKQFFDRDRLLRTLQEWIVFFQQDDEWHKIILRQHQTRAVAKVVERAVDPAKRRGLVWHTQGSGKTFTMIKAAQQIVRHPAFENPTVVMLIDRNELEGQLAGWISRVLGEKAAVVASSKRRLRELLISDRRGLIVSMIHKFGKADANLSTRENVVVLVDEAHRTTGGDLGNYLVAALPNATFIGFSGTPRDKTTYGSGTFKVFGKEDLQGYLDKYPIAESIADGTTLPLRYALAPNAIRVPVKLLEKEFLALAQVEGVSDVEQLNRILDRAVNLKAFLKSSARVEKVAAFVAKHFRENVERLGYKAFLVGVDREACALYKQALDKLLPPDYSRVVYSSAHNDIELLAQFRLNETAEKLVRKDFTKGDKLPKILIVTEKLLTGFDAPILYCMYLDKPMRDHVLLQAIARVNRPYEEEGDLKKPCGFVLDFVGIFSKLEKALAFDSDVVSGVTQNVEVLQRRFEKLMTETAPPYIGLAADTKSDKGVERVIEAFSDKTMRENFLTFYKDLQDMYEILSPAAFLRPYLHDYSRLADLFRLTRSRFGGTKPLERDLMRKTEALVQETVGAKGLTRLLPVQEINEDTLRMLRESRASYQVKVNNLVKCLEVSAERHQGMQLVLLSIGKRAQAVVEAYEGQQGKTKQALKELEGLVAEALEAKREQVRRGFDDATFGLYWTLKKKGVRAAVSLARGAACVLRQHADWQSVEGGRREVAIALTAFFVKSGVKAEAPELVQTVLQAQHEPE